MSLGSWRFPLSLLSLDEKAFELGRIRVGVNHGRREHVNGVQGRLPLVFCNPAVTPVNGNPDLIRLLAVNHHGLDTARDHSLGNVLAAGAAHFDFVTPAHPEIARQFNGNFDRSEEHTSELQSPMY